MPGLRICAVTAMLLLGAPASAQAPAIGGLYCGTALSGGRYVEVRTRLEQRDGLLTGSYDFADDGDTTSGELQESLAQSDRSRTMVWRDRYGSGLVTFDFDPSGASFTGRWGVDLQIPDLPWNGKRCDTPSV